MADIFPTKSNLMAMEKSLDLALLGYELMDRKKNILVREMMQLVEEAKTIRQEINDCYNEAYRCLRLANTTLGICYGFSESIPIDTSVSLDYKSVMGVEIPVIKSKPTQIAPYFGLTSTNEYLDKAYLSFNLAKEKTLRLAEIESGVYRLADAVKKTRKRANALNNIMIPKFQKNIKFISEALAEKEREDFTRLKVIKSQKEKQ